MFVNLLTTIDSPWRALQFRFWLRDDQTVPTAANSRQSRSGSRHPDGTREFIGNWRPKLRPNRIGHKRFFIEQFKSYQMMCIIFNFNKKISLLLLVSRDDPGKSQYFHFIHHLIIVTLRPNLFSDQLEPKRLSIEFFKSYPTVYKQSTLE
jgi:hypothetical protein